MLSIPLLLILVVLFVVLWPCIWFAIEQTGLRHVNQILAPAATILCILSMTGSIHPVRTESLIETVLIPWAALGYSMVFVLLLCLLRFLSRNVLRYLDDGSRRWEQVTKRRQGGSLGQCEKENVDCDGFGDRDGKEHTRGALAREDERRRYE